MTQAKSTKRRRVLERNAAEVVAILATGEKHADVARLYQCDPSAVTRFEDRHAVAIEEMRCEVERQVRDFAIAQQVNRIAAKDLRWNLLEEVRRQRAKGETGESTGLVVKTYKSLGSGRAAQIVEEYKVDDGLLAAMERAERGTAEELGQLPKNTDTPAVAVAVAIEVSVGW